MRMSRRCCKETASIEFQLFRAWCHLFSATCDSFIRAFGASMLLVGHPAYKAGVTDSTSWQLKIQPPNNLRQLHVNSHFQGELGVNRFPSFFPLVPEVDYGDKLRSFRQAGYLCLLPNHRHQIAKGNSN